MVDLVTGNLDPEAAGQAEAHIDRCSTCRLVLIELARVFELKASSLPEDDATTESDLDRPSEDDVPLLMQPPAMMRGTTIGRYLVLDVLGAGAMGVVYAAFDPELDRKVALKLLHARAVGKVSSERLVREARSTAKLAHPNVVVVHDVGEHAGAVFMAMEYVEGGTLGEWLAEERREHDEILDAFREAGLGLQAAHEAGLVHRDFKPANVLMGRDGRPRVTDFGLARGDGSAPASEELLATHPGAKAKLLDATFTRTGARVGTPAYMSPEQHLGEVADARSDQFSFCVALWEALFGERPFEGETITALAVAVTTGAPKDPPADVSTPATLLRALGRGLARDPAERYPSVGALLRDVDPPKSARGRWLFPAGGLVLAAGGVAWGVSAQSEPERCAGAREAIAASWNAERATQLRAQWSAHGRFGSDTATQLVKALDRYTVQWVDAHTLACEATRVRQERSEAMLDASMACLAGRKAELVAAVDLLGQPDEDVLLRGLEIADGLPSVDTCGDVQILSGVEPPPKTGEAAEAFADMQRNVGRAGALLDAGKYKDAKVAAEAAVVAAQASGYAPGISQSKARVGNTLYVLGEVKRAEAQLLDAYFVASAHLDAMQAARSAGELMRVEIEKANFDAARLWYRHADAAMQQVGKSAEDDARLSQNLGVLHLDLGEFDQSEAAYQRAVELEPNPVSTGAANAINDLALLNEKRGDYDKALEFHQRALEIRTELGGARHPDVAGSHNNIGLVLHNRGEFREAKRHYELALDIETEAAGPDSLTLTNALNNLGASLNALGEIEQARETFERCLAIRQKHLEPDDPLIASVYKGLGAIATDLDDFELAREHYSNALAILEKAYDPKHYLVGEMLFRTADLARRTEDYARADEFFERAREAFVASFPGGHPFIGLTVRDHARVRLSQGEYAVAQAGFEKALPELEQGLGENNREVAITHALLGRAIDAQGRYEEAIRHWTLAVEIREKGDSAALPPTAFAYLGLAQSHLALGQLPQAQAAVESAKRVAAKHADHDGLQGRLAEVQAKLADRHGDRAAADEFAATARAKYEAADATGDLAKLAQWQRGR